VHAMPISKDRRPATDAEARALASAVRLRILRMCLDRALTNKEIAQRLDANPATTLHHVRTLVATGFLRPEAERRGTRNSREVPYLATGKSWRMDVTESGVSGTGAAMLTAFLTEIEQVDKDDAKLGRLGLRLSPDELVELRTRLDELLNEYATRVPTPDGQPYSIFVALHPDPNRD
jgi:DNA-binding transcriptional ArsR family regulator